MNDFANMRVWSEEDATSTNPICLEDIEEDRFEEELVKKQNIKTNKKKRRGRRRRKKALEEDANSMLSSILSESDELSDNGGKAVVPTLPTKFHEKRELEKRHRRERLADLKMRRNTPKVQVQVKPTRSSLYPSSDEESNNDDLSKNPFADDDDDLSKNPFSDQNETAISDDNLSKNPFSDRKKNTVADDDLSKNPFADDDDLSKNPFADDSIRDRAVSDKEYSDDSDDEDIVESSRRLLRCVDQRIQYQQQNDDVKHLKAQLKQMKAQAEAMAEQLRRAIETKCDLVLAQNEMERRHEQDGIAQDGEQRDLRKYIQEILETQAQSEMNFMNEIASLAGTMEANKAKHEKEIEGKESKIFQLETKFESMKVSSVRGSSSESFRNRFDKDIIVIHPTYE